MPHRAQWCRGIWQLQYPAQPCWVRAVHDVILTPDVPWVPPGLGRHWGQSGSGGSVAVSCQGGRAALGRASHTGTGSPSINQCQPHVPCASPVPQSLALSILLLPQCELTFGSCSYFTSGISTSNPPPQWDSEQWLRSKCRAWICLPSQGTAAGKAPL